MLAREGFDPPSSVVFARRASSAPPRYTMITHFFIYKGLNLISVTHRNKSI